MEDLITFETAKLAKEKGFIGECRNAYKVKGGKEKLHMIGSEYVNDTLFTLAPTQSLLQKWLWVNHKVWVEITLWGDGIGFQCLVKQAKGKETDGSTLVRKLTDIQVFDRSDPYKLKEIALQESLKLI